MRSGPGIRSDPGAALACPALAYPGAMMPKPVTVERIIPAPAEKIFDLLADPAGHARIDGSGTVTAARSGGRRLANGG